MEAIGVGLVGTGFAAQMRADALKMHDRVLFQGVAGNDLDRSQAFSDRFEVRAFPDISSLLAADQIDLVIIANQNHHHAAVAKAALEAGKHVVVEYPLALDWTEAKALQRLAQERDRLLHVEHIELLGGWHQALRDQLAQVGQPRLVRYATIQSKRPAPDHWTYRLAEFGFPFVAALSRIHRLTDVLGAVTAVQGQAQFFPKALSSPSNSFKTCICTAQLIFAQGTIAIVTYAKGEDLWRSERLMEIQGDRGTLRFDEEVGTLITEAGETIVDLGGRRGLFAKDTAAIVEFLLEGKALYVNLEASLYALKVANAIQRSAATGQTIVLDVLDSEMG